LYYEYRSIKPFNKNELFEDNEHYDPDEEYEIIESESFWHRFFKSLDLATLIFGAAVWSYLFIGIIISYIIT
jgi:hypothetical protein